MESVTAIIVSFYRYEYLEKCVQSLRTQYPDINIIIGNNGTKDKRKEKLAKKYGAEFYQLPFDCGVCVGRNMLIDKVKTKYVLVGDDDFYYEPESNLKDMLKIKADLVGGRIRENGEIKNYQGIIKEYKDHFEYIKTDKEGFVDLTFNFFIAKTKAVKSVQWDENIKVAYEHSTFFIDFKRKGYSVYYKPDSIVTHKPKVKIDTEEYAMYKTFRSRKSDKRYFFQKFKIDYCIDMNGRKDTPEKIEVVKKQTPQSEIAFCITTFLRKDALERLLKSIKRYYPFASIYIADQSFDSNYYKKLWKTLNFPKKPVAWSMPHDCGLSYARNYLVKTCKEKYKLIIEDDFVFTADTDINKLKKVADYTEGIVGGALTQAGKIRHFEHHFEKRGNVLHIIEDEEDWKEIEGIRYRKTGCVFNFMLVKKEKWDEELKLSEHTDFFLRNKDVYYVPEVVIEHRQVTNNEYQQFRSRNDYLLKMMKKWDISKMIYPSGFVYEKKQNKIISYRNKI